MGGRLNLVIREESEKIHSLETFTGIDDFIVFSTEFNKGEYQMIIDKTLKFIKKNDGLVLEDISPENYGTLVFDFKNKVIHSLQCYQNPGEFPVSYFLPSRILDSDIEKLLQVVIQNNFLEIAEYSGEFQNSPKNSYGTLNEFFNEKISIKKLKEKIADAFRNSKNYLIISANGEHNLSIFDGFLVPSGLNKFQIIHYDDFGLDDSQKSFIHNLETSGFKISQETLEKFKKFIKN